MMEAESSDIKAESSTSADDNGISKLGVCEVCAFKEAKYTCPKCEVKTCSLKCNKIHKLEIECDGERDRTKFIPINKFTNLDLSSDYRLLEEISRNLETSRKNFGEKYRFIPPYLFKLRNAAQQRKINLKFLPNNFERHKNNTTKFQKIIYWHIEWIFINADNLKLIDSQVPETEKIGAVINKYFTAGQDNFSEKLQYYHAVGLPGVKLLLKAEQKPGKKFYELDPVMSLAECLQKRIIIEYPTVYVVLKDHACFYDVIDSDDESMETENKKSGNQLIQRLIDNADNEENLFRSLKNLLFNSEYSDGEISS